MARPKKYVLKRKYFVLKPEGTGKHANAARHALRAYALCIEWDDRPLAEELRKWANEEERNSKTEGG